MTNTMRIRLAALVTATFIGALSVAGLAVRGHGHGQVAAKPAQAQPRTTQQVSTFGDEELELDED
jgi:hypothetical protein